MIHFNLKNRLAFTMLELVFVIVVLGILAALALPRLDRDLKQEAADSILSDIRYTQHLALIDDMHLYNFPDWQKRYWVMIFSTCTGTDKFYMIGSDNDRTGSTNGNFSSLESATDPANGKRMHWTGGNDCSNGGGSGISDRIFISKKYGITAVDPSGDCISAAHIAFDHLGRPHHGAGFANSSIPNHAGYMDAACTFTFTMSDGDTFAIVIQPETGYAQIVGQPDS